MPIMWNPFCSLPFLVYYFMFILFCLLLVLLFSTSAFVLLIGYLVSLCCSFTCLPLSFLKFMETF